MLVFYHTTWFVDEPYQQPVVHMYADLRESLVDLNSEISEYVVPQDEPSEAERLTLEQDLRQINPGGPLALLDRGRPWSEVWTDIRRVEDEFNAYSSQMKKAYNTAFLEGPEAEWRVIPELAPAYWINSQLRRYCTLQIGGPWFYGPTIEMEVRAGCYEWPDHIANFVERLVEETDYPVEIEHQPAHHTMIIRINKHYIPLEYRLRFVENLVPPPVTERLRP